MPKRKHSRSREEDMEYLRSKIRKLERKYQKCARSESVSSQEEVIPLAENVAATPTLQPEDWLPECETTEMNPVLTDENTNDPPSASSALMQPQTATCDVAPVEPRETSETVNENMPDLDSDILEILGDDPTKTDKYGPDIRKELASRLLHVATEGLTKENRKDLMAKYPIPANCTNIDAPKLNPEIKAAVRETAIKRDAGIEVKQKQMASAISGLSEVINTLLSSKDKNNAMLQKLMDTSRILCDIQHADSITRRNFVLFGLKNDLRDHLKNTKIDSFLFGENLPETLKSAKAVNKSGVELKYEANKQTTTKRYKQPDSKNLNRKPVPQARRPLVAPGHAPRGREPAAPRGPPRPPPPAYSSRTSSHTYQPPPPSAPTYPRRRY